MFYIENILDFFKAMPFLRETIIGSSLGLLSAFSMRIAWNLELHLLDIALPYLKETEKENEEESEKKSKSMIKMQLTGVLSILFDTVIPICFAISTIALVHEKNMATVSLPKGASIELLKTALSLVAVFLLGSEIFSNKTRCLLTELKFPECDFVPRHNKTRIVVLSTLIIQLFLSVKNYMSYFRIVAGLFSFFFILFCFLLASRRILAIPHPAEQERH